MSISDNDKGLLAKLTERVKELSALHKTSRILQDNTRPSIEIMRDIVEIVPESWQYPEHCAARIDFRDLSVVSSQYDETEWKQTADFTAGGFDGKLIVCYLKELPEEYEGPFLREERDLIDSLAEMLRFYFQHQIADQELLEAKNGLEEKVEERTSELRRINRDLSEKIREYNQARVEIERYQKRLRKLAGEVSLAEERERREIATDLHDHLGQALAYIKIKISEFQGETIFCGYQGSLNEITSLLNRAIEYTRSLTFEISPPVLYELGIGAALEWLAERFGKTSELMIGCEISGSPRSLGEEIQVFLFKAARELLVNITKHAKANDASITLEYGKTAVSLKVRDNGRGMNPDLIDTRGEEWSGFGLFSIKERLRNFGGEMSIQSSSGEGTEVSLTIPDIKENGS